MGLGLNHSSQTDEIYKGARPMMGAGLKVPMLCLTLTHPHIDGFRSRGLGH